MERFAEFPADYVVEAMPNLPVFIDRSFQLPQTPPRPDLIFQVYDETGMHWTGAARAAEPSTTKALTGLFASPNPKTLVAVVRGLPYLIPVKRRDYEVIAAKGPIVQVVPAVDEGLLLLATPWTVLAIDSSTKVWETPRIAIDGLRVDRISDGQAIGWADPNDPEAREFAIALSTGAHTGGTTPGL